MQMLFEVRDHFVAKLLSFFSNFLEALAQLRDVIIGPYGYLNGSREVMQENIPPLENCISAVGKILKYAPGLLGDQRSALLSDWLSWLPVVEDKEEATHVYSFICDLIERFSNFFIKFSSLLIVWFP